MQSNCNNGFKITCYASFSEAHRWHRCIAIVQSKHNTESVIYKYKSTNSTSISAATLFIDSHIKWPSSSIVPRSAAHGWGNSKMRNSCSLSWTISCPLGLYINCPLGWWFGLAISGRFAYFPPQMLIGCFYTRRSTQPVK